jgi:hypothetical protein
MKSKGAQYSTFFRKAGMAWGKGDVHKAIAILTEGVALATARGDAQVAQVLRQDLKRYQRLAASTETESW